jgi:hypothetical protein
MLEPPICTAIGPDSATGGAAQIWVIGNAAAAQSISRLYG